MPDDGVLKVTLAASVGNLFLQGTDGLTFTSGANGDQTMTFRGTATQIKAALNGLIFVPPIQHNNALPPPTTITITTEDEGRFGPPPAPATPNRVDVDTITISITPVNDPPQFTLVDQNLATIGTIDVVRLEDEDVGGGPGVHLSRALPQVCWLVRPQQRMNCWPRQWPLMCRSSHSPPSCRSRSRRRSIQRAH